MLIEFLNVIYVDKKPMAENIRLNIQPLTHRLRLKITYISGEEKTPIDVVVFKWSPKLDKLALSITIDGKDMTTNTDFLIKLSYDVLKRQLKLTGRVGDEDVKIHITNIRDFMEIPKLVSRKNKQM